MPRSDKAEIQRKERRLFYAKIDGNGMLAGDVLGVMSGGGALAELEGDDLLIAKFNDNDAPAKIGCLESFYSPIHGRRPATVDLTKIAVYESAQQAYSSGRGSATDAARDLLVKDLLDSRDDMVTYRPDPVPE